MNPEPASLSGRTVRFAWNDGPTRGVIHEHVFHVDGTVEWRRAGTIACYGAGFARKPERPKYTDEKVADGVRMVSYRSDSGYTLTAVLNFGDHSIVGVASNERNWVPVHGSFEIVS